MADSVCVSTPPPHRVELGWGTVSPDLALRTAPSTRHTSSALATVAAVSLPTRWGRAGALPPPPGPGSQRAPSVPPEGRKHGGIIKCAGSAAYRISRTSAAPAGVGDMAARKNPLPLPFLFCEDFDRGVGSARIGGTSCEPRKPREVIFCPPCAPHCLSCPRRWPQCL